MATVVALFNAAVAEGSVTLDNLGESGFLEGEGCQELFDAQFVDGLLSPEALALLLAFAEGA